MNLKLLVRKPSFIATQGHSRSFILQSVTGQQGIAYRHIILLALSLTFLKNYFTQIAKNCRRQQPHSHLRSPPRGTTASIRIHLIFPETRVIGLHFCRCIYGSKFIQILCSGLQKTHLFCTRVRFGRSRSFRVIGGRWFRYQSKARIRLPISQSSWLWSYLAPFLRYGDLLAKNSLFLLHFWCPSLTRRPHSLCSLWNFVLKLTVRKLESRGYPPAQLLLLPVIQWINQSINPASKRL